MLPISDVVPARTRPVVALGLVAALLAAAAAIAAGARLPGGGVLAAWLGPAALLPTTVANLIALGVFGENVEDRLGHARFLLLYVAAGAAALAAQSALGATLPVPLAAGGAVAGIAGAYVAILPASRVHALVPFPPFLVEVPALFVIGAWLVLQIPLGAAAFAGVAAGALVGAASTPWMALRERRRVEWWSP